MRPGINSPSWPEATMTENDQLPEKIREKLLKIKEKDGEDGVELDDADLDRIAGGAYTGHNFASGFELGVIGRGTRSRNGST
jgi:hypothetical protein